MNCPDWLSVRIIPVGASCAGRRVANAIMEQMMRGLNMDEDQSAFLAGDLASDLAGVVAADALASPGGVAGLESFFAAAL